MARLKGGIFGEITGKLDKLVVRHVKGRTVVSLRPKNYRKSKSKKAKNVRNKFAVAVEFSRYINSIPELKSIWLSAFRKCYSVFNLIEKYNIKLVENDAPSLRNIITPALITLPSKIVQNLSCPYPFEDFTFNSKTISAVPSKDFILENISGVSATIVFVFCFHTPMEKENKYFIMDHIIYPLNTSGTSAAEMSISLSPSVKKNSALYNKVRIYSAAFIKHNNKYGYKFSQTFSKEYDLTV